MYCVGEMHGSRSCLGFVALCYQDCGHILKKISFVCLFFISSWTQNMKLFVLLYHSSEETGHSFWCSVLMKPSAFVLGVVRTRRAALSLQQAFLFFLPPCNRQLRSHAYASGVRGEKGVGCTGRLCQEVACPFTVIVTFCALLFFYLPQISGSFVVAGRCYKMALIQHISALNQQSTDAKQQLFTN